MSSLFAFKRWFTGLIAAFVLITNGLIPNGYMLDHADDTGAMIIRICTGGNNADRYVSWNLQTGEQTPVDGSEKDISDNEHDQDDAGDMLCAIASHVFIAETQYVQRDYVEPTYVKFKAPLARGPPLFNITAAPLPARGPPIFLS